MFAGNVRDGPDGLSDAAIGWRQTEQQPASWEVAMTTVYVFMESCGDKYSVEWVYLDRDQSYRFALHHTGIAPGKPVQVEQGQTNAPPEHTTARTIA